MTPLKLRVASPCTESWAAMVGDERVRHCGQCQMNVFNLSSLSRAEVDTLLQKAEGRVCGRFYQRTDGTVLTADCPVGLRRARARMAAALTAALALVVVGLGLLRRTPKAPGEDFKTRLVAVEDSLRGTPVLGAFINWVDPPQVLMLGDISAP